MNYFNGKVVKAWYCTKSLPKGNPENNMLSDKRKWKEKNIDIQGIKFLMDNNDYLLFHNRNFETGEYGFYITTTNLCMIEKNLKCLPFTINKTDTLLKAYQNIIGPNHKYTLKNSNAYIGPINILFLFLLFLIFFRLGRQYASIINSI